jgi:hypothetical protein
VLLIHKLYIYIYIVYTLDTWGVATPLFAGPA